MNRRTKVKKEKVELKKVKERHMSLSIYLSSETVTQEVFDILEREDLRKIQLRKGRRSTHNNLLQTLPEMRVVDHDAMRKAGRKEKTYKMLPCFIKRQQAHFLLPDIPPGYDEKQPKIELFVRKEGHYYQVFNGLSDTSLREATRQARRLNARQKRQAEAQNEEKPNSSQKDDEEQESEEPGKKPRKDTNKQDQEQEAKRKTKKQEPATKSPQRRSLRVRKKARFKETQNEDESLEDDADIDVKGEDVEDDEDDDPSKSTTISPQNKKRKRDNNTQEEKKEKNTSMLCVCNQPESGFMIGCDTCGVWWHGTCVNITQEQAKDIAAYVCPRCKDKDQNSATEKKTKKKVRKPKENTPIGSIPPGG